MSRLLFVMLSLILLVVGCTSRPTSLTLATPEAVLPASTPSNDADTDSRDFLSICQLMDNPSLYNGQNVHVKTTFVRIGSEQWFGDDNCVTRHTLFNAEFEPSFHEFICNDKTHYGDNLCNIVDPAKNSLDLSVTAVFSGHFEYYRAKTGFTRAGHRFRLKVENVRSISEIKNIKPVRIK